MRLIYMALFTIFAVLSAFIFIVTIVTYSLPGLIIGLILGLLATFCGYKYKKYGKAEKQALEQKVKLEKEEHKDSLDQYTQSINKILFDRHHFKIPYRPEFLTYTKYAHDNADYLMFMDGLRPEEAAQIIYKEVLSQGDDYNPQIIQEQFLRNKLSKYANIYKALFGSHNPSHLRISLSIILMVLAILTFYGFNLRMFKGSEYDSLFIPSAEWTNIAWPLTWLLASCLMIAIIRNPDTRERLKGKYSRPMQGLIYISCFATFLMFIYVPLDVAIPRIANKMFGREHIANLYVVKNLTKRSSSKDPPFTPYCVEFLLDISFPVQNEFCISKSAYDRLPDRGTIQMTFSVTSSYWGQFITGTPMSTQY